jgi:hypothetical protein
MKFQQLQQILEYLVASRGAMGRLYQRLSLQTDSPRATMLFDYMAQNEQIVIDKLETYLDQAPDRVLGADFDDVYFEDFVSHCEHTTHGAGMNEQDALGLALNLENRLLSLMHSALTVAACADVQKALQTLLESERTRQQRFVHNTHRMANI